jgi:VIT1/CCC1 family predicted Fe2+/Mn2+ transporter
VSQDVVTPREEGAEPSQERPTSGNRLRLSSRLNHAFATVTGFDDRTFLLRVVQPALVGMIDGTVSTLAPIFAAAISSSSHTALVVGIATALGAGVSMGLSEALSDTGEETGRGSAVVRGAITGAATAFGGVFHSLPFIIHDVHTALIVAGIVVAVELFVIAWVRYRFLHVSLRSSLLMVTCGGAIVVGIGVLIGSS